MDDRFKEKTREGETTRELDCPDGYKGVDGKCVKMTAREMRNRSNSAHKSKRVQGNKQKYIDKKRQDSIEKNENTNMKDKIRQLVREEIKSILKEDSSKKLEKALKQHDWQYRYADDHRHWVKGEKELKNILTLIKQTDPKIAEKLWKGYAPKSDSFPKNVYNKPVEKVIDKTPKRVKRFKKGDRVLVDNLIYKFIGTITKETGWDFNDASNKYNAKYDIKVEKVFSKNSKELGNEGKTIEILDFYIKGKK